MRFPIRKGLLQRTAGAFVAVDGVSFAIPAGRTLALVGESGCGKTTTGKAIVQLLRHQALIGGQAMFQGQDLFTLEGDALRDARRAVQIIFQDPFASLDPRMRVFDILEEGLLALRPEHGRDSAPRTAADARRPGRACGAKRCSATRTNFPAASASASPSRARWRSSRG